MTVHRFFIDSSRIDAQKSIRLDADDARHIRTVLRLGRGGTICLIDENQNRYSAVIEKVTRRDVYARVLEKIDSEPTASRAALTIVQGIPRLPKADLITQKLTELGARAVAFVPTQRSPYRDSYDRISRRLPRLRKIAEAAAKQCARRDIPSVSVHGTLKEALENAAPGALLLAAHEKSKPGNLCELLAKVAADTPISVFIGPEGGLSDDEAGLLEEMGAASFSLGRNILRTETAAIAAAVIILYELGEI